MQCSPPSRVSALGNRRICVISAEGEDEIGEEHLKCSPFLGEFKLA